MKALLLALALVLLPAVARAHGTRTAYVEVLYISATEASIVLHDPKLEVLAEAGCTLGPPPVVQLRCRDGIAGATLTLRGADAIVVRLRDEGDRTTVLTPAAPHLALPGRGSSGSILSRYTKLGIGHVLSGLDHILLLVALFWGADLARPKREVAVALAKTTATFTIAHSLSLAAVALGVVRIPSAPAEALIAASLVLVALERRHRRDLVFAFGLVHGLGFASGLVEVGLPEAQAALALLAFNVGVEIAQLLVLASAFVLSYLPLVRSRHLPLVSSYAVGVTGAYLFLLRASALLR